MNQRHIVSCFNGTINGWYKQSPEKNHVRQSSLLQQLQQNLHRYEDQNNRLSKQRPQRYEVEQVRLPLLTNVKSNANLQLKKVSVSKGPRFESQLNYKKIAPLKMKTIMIYNMNQNNQHEEPKQIKRHKKTICYDQNKDKYRKKFISNFQRIKQIGPSMLEFSDDRFFRDAATIQQKSKSVKLHLLGK